MPRLRSRKVAAAGEVDSSDEMVTSPGSWAVGAGREPGEKLVAKQSPRLAHKRKPKQPLSPWAPPDPLSSLSCEQLASPVPKQEKERTKAAERDSSARAVKKLRSNRDRPEDSNEKEHHSSKSSGVAALNGTQGESSPCCAVTTKSGVQRKAGRPRIDQIKRLQSSSVAAAEKGRKPCAKRDAEPYAADLNSCTRLLCATEKNPFVRLEACSYINTFVQSSASGSTSSYKTSGFLHVAQDQSKRVLPAGTGEQSDMNCSTRRMHSEGPPVQGDLSLRKEKNPKGDGSLSCCQSESSTCLRVKRWNAGRKPRKRVKITEESATQTGSAGTARGRSEFELQTEAAVATSGSFAGSALNRREINLSASHDQKGKTAGEAHKSVRRKCSTKSLGFEDGFEKTSEPSAIAKGEHSGSVSCGADAFGSAGVPAPGRDVSGCHKRKRDEKRNRVNQKLQKFTCQRAVPMAGKRVWPLESCARTSAWARKHRRPASERKRFVRAACEESSGESRVHPVGNDAATGSSRCWGVSAVEMNEESACRTVALNAGRPASPEAPEASSLFPLRTSSDNAESLVYREGSAVTLNRGDVREVKATLSHRTTQKHETEGTATERNQSDTVWSSTAAGNTDSPRASVVSQTALNLKLMKLLSTGNPTKFKIPLRRNKPESERLEPAGSLESRSRGPCEFLDSISVAGRQEPGEDTSLVSAEQQAFPVGSDAVSAAAVKKEEGETNSGDFQRDSSESLSEEVSVLPEGFSLCLQPFLEEQPESPVPDFPGTECALKPDFPDPCWNAGDPPAAGGSNDENKSRGGLPQPKSQLLPDILEAFEEDALIIDVIEDDPDLFGSSTEKEHAPADSERCPSQAAGAAVGVADEEQELKPKCPVVSEGSSSVDGSFRSVLGTSVQERGAGASPKKGCKGFGVGGVFQTNKAVTNQRAVVSRHVTVKGSGLSNDAGSSCDWVPKAEEVKTHSSSRGSSPLGGVPEDFLEDGQPRELDELLKSFDMDKKLGLAEGAPGGKQRRKSEADQSDCECKDLVKSELLSALPLHGPKVYVLGEATAMKPQTNGTGCSVGEPSRDYRFSGKCPSVPGQNLEDLEPWKMEKKAADSHTVQQILETIELPPKYCRYYFTTLRGCDRSKCWFWHVPEQGDERVCLAILRTYIGIRESGLLRRAVQIFVKYHREDTAGVDLASQVLNDLLVSLLKTCLLQEVFQILNVAVRINTLPAVDVLLSVFKHVAALNRRDAVPTLISTFCKLVDAGLFLQSEHFDCIVKSLRQLQVSRQHMNAVLSMKSRFQVRHSEKGWLFDFSLAVAEIQHCKERSDWTKLGALYVNARTGCERFDDLQKLSVSVVQVLTRDSDTDRPGVPFCDFADAVMKHSQHNEADKVFVGRTGISVMCSYHRGTQWIKGRKVLDKMHELQIDFTVLKGLTDAERLVSRCQIVNTAAEIFLKTGSLDGATWVLRESEWTINSPLWPCSQMDILNRHNLLCTLEHQFLKRSLYRQALEVLQNLPGFQNSCDTVDLSQYSCLFNNLVNACFESKNLGVSSSAVDFMLSKKIAVNCVLLRGLITALGRSSLWSKARTYYKSALSLGYYPAPHGNVLHKRLMIPSHLSEVEMLLAIEIFLVSNASEITSPMAVSPTLQVILKRCEDQAAQNSCDYQTAAKRLVLAARLSDPKLSLRHVTMNVNMEEVYSLELPGAQTWLQENMKWAGKVWLFQ